MTIITLTARPDERRIRVHRITANPNDRQWALVYSRGELPNVDTIDLRNTGSVDIYYIAARNDQFKPEGGAQQFDIIAAGETVSEESDPETIRVVRADPASVGELRVVVKFFSEEKLARIREEKARVLGAR